MVRDADKMAELSLWCRVLGQVAVVSVEAELTAAQARLNYQSGLL